jgi:hypothetical protein
MAPQPPGVPLGHGAARAARPSQQMNLAAHFTCGDNLCPRSAIGRLVVDRIGCLIADGKNAVQFPRAAVVCTGNTCWHATEKYDYPPDARVTIHEDAWKPGPSITFREHTGPGYWAGETWKAW